MTTDLILGTAGHIDHGKTAMVRALTGVDTDRLPEEQRRGITIDLGYAELRLEGVRLGIVDVPGHERFVRNMLAGATGIDLALLVVAADDSVKQQTREHLDILRLLNLKTGVIALTKCDVAEPDWIDLVEDEVRELVSGTFLADAPIVRTSAKTGLGIEDLKQALSEAAARLGLQESAEASSGPFRMAIDRVFSIAGHGTVVTGSVLCGRAAVGEELVIHPGEKLARVRGLRNHDVEVEQVERGQRAAINLAGVRHEEIARGQELATPGFLVPSRLLTVEMRMLDSAPRPLKNRRRVRMHVGTAEQWGTIVLYDRDQLGPGETALAQVFLREPTVATWGQPFVLRSESPIVTIGGGRVLAPTPWKLRATSEADWAEVENLRSDDLHVRAGAAVYFARLDPWQPIDLARGAGATDPEAATRKLVADETCIETLRLSPSRTVCLHRSHAEALRAKITAVLDACHEANPRQLAFPVTAVTGRLGYLQDEALVQTLLTTLVERKMVLRSDQGIALAGKGPQLSKSERKLLDEIIHRFRETGLRPPGVGELQKNATRNQAAVPQLVELAAAQGILVRLTDDLFLHADTETAARATLERAMAKGEGHTLSQIRELLDTTRKYAVPLCEYFDRIGFTRREGDQRVLEGS